MTGRLEGRARGLHERKRCREIHLECATPRRHALLLEWHGPPSKARRANQRRVVDQDVQPAEPVYYPQRRQANSILVLEINPDGERTHPVLFGDLRRHRLRPRLVDVEQRHRCTEFGQGGGHRTADVPRATGNKRRPPRQIHQLRDSSHRASV